MCLHFVIPSGARRSRGISQFMSDDRKTPEMRATMTDIERLRHSASHVLATAILKIWPEAQFAAGPPVENGFYYDVDLPHRISPDDFEKIETEMQKEIKANHPFERMEVSRDEALELGRKGRLAALSDRSEPSKFKLDIIENIPPDEKISLYRNGDFIDLCAGPHVMRTGNIGAFKLTNVASAYYKGDEKNPQLQRVYGTAFKTKKELDDYFCSMTTSAQVCRCFCRAARLSLKNWRSSQKKPSSPPAISASAHRTLREKFSTRRAAISPIISNQCSRLWHYTMTLFIPIGRLVLSRKMQKAT
ncbi:MAG: hypothetical protein DME75_05145 [Verrucomicrobia bacterium]|nr:MAG: hypothetical protein DME75_05145 [Verrucomicrobiota bacterium]